MTFISLILLFCVSQFLLCNDNSKVKSKMHSMYVYDSNSKYGELTALIISHAPQICFKYTLETLCVLCDSLIP